jgi:hypothetical protein
MNEATAYCNGECPEGVSKMDDFITQTTKRNLNESNDDNGFWYTSYNNQSVESTYNLPFIPGKVNLDNMSLSLNGTHYDTSHSRNLTEYDVHSIFGHMQGKRAFEFLDSDKSVNPGKR